MVTRRARVVAGGLLVAGACSDATFAFVGSETTARGYGYTGTRSTGAGSFTDATAYGSGSVSAAGGPLARAVGPGTVTVATGYE